MQNKLNIIFGAIFMLITLMLFLKIDCWNISVLLFEFMPLYTMQLMKLSSWHAQTFMASNRAENLLDFSISLIFKSKSFTKISKNSLNLIRSLVIQYYREIGKNALRFSGASLRSKPDLNDFRLSFMFLGSSIFRIFLDNETRKTLSLAISEAKEKQEPSSLPSTATATSVSISHEMLVRKQKIAKQLKLEHVHPFFPSFPKLHTFSNIKVDHHFIWDYKLCRRFKCIKKRESSNSLTLFFYKTGENRIKITPIGSKEVFRGCIPSREKEI